MPPSQQFLISLTTLDNDYQQEQAAAAEAAAHRLGVQVRIIDAENDAIRQSQQLLEAIQSPVGSRPAAIVFEPVGTGLPKVAQAAVAARVAWVVLNREVGYLQELRSSGSPVQRGGFPRSPWLASGRGRRLSRA